MNNSFMFYSSLDEQANQLISFFDVAVSFEEFGVTWSFTIWERTVRLQINGQEHLVKAGSIIYVRGSLENCKNRFSELNFLTLVLESYEPFKIIMARKILNKLQPLLWTTQHPETVIVQHRLINLPSDSYVVKGLSGIKTTPVMLNQRSLQTQIPQIPTMIQRAVKGKEYKTTIYRNDTFDELTVEIIKKTTAGEQSSEHPWIIILEHNQNPIIREYARKIFDETHLKYYDIDYIVEESGLVQILEWNNSPATASIESHFFGSPLKTACAWAPSAQFTISQYADGPCQVLDIEKRKLGFQLFIEDLNAKWRIEKNLGGLFIWLNRRPFLINKIYLRSVNLSSNSEQNLNLISFYEMIELGGKKVIGRNSTQFLNGSKLRQMASTLTTALAKQKNLKIALPDSYVVKGLAQIEKNSFLLDDKIVKSLSAVRSKVVGFDEFKKWLPRGLNDLPTLFQKKV
nr:hypothetical protein [Pseudobdellovibrionaceae bacterium]